MTDLVKLAKRLYRRIQWQEIPETLTQEDLLAFLCDAIRMLYVISGRTFEYSDDLFLTELPSQEPDEEPDESDGTDDGQATDDPSGDDGDDPGEGDPVYLYFANDLELDEQEWVLLESEIAFYNLALSNVDDLQSYTTDAMAVTHGDKPYKNIKATIEDRQAKQAVVWTRMVRFNQLGVSG